MRWHAARPFIEQQRPVPSFIVLDQPSQAFFPRDRETGGDLDELTDTDRENTRRLYELAFHVVQQLGSALQRKAMDELGIDVFEAAAMFWGGGYDPAADELTEGPFAIVVSRAVEAAQCLHAGIYRAARAVDASRLP